MKYILKSFLEENYILHAVHDESGKKKKIGEFKSKDLAASHVEYLDHHGKWPEGHDAILTSNRTGKKHMYSDDWESLDEAKSNPYLKKYMVDGEHVGYVSSNGSNKKYWRNSEGGLTKAKSHSGISDISGEEHNTPNKKPIQEVVYSSPEFDRVSKAIKNNEEKYAPDENHEMIKDKDFLLFRKKGKLVNRDHKYGPCAVHAITGKKFWDVKGKVHTDEEYQKIKHKLKEEFLDEGKKNFYDIGSKVKINYQGNPFHGHTGEVISHVDGKNTKYHKIRLKHGNTELMDPAELVGHKTSVKGIKWINEGKMKEIWSDLQNMNHGSFVIKYKKTKAQMKASMKSDDDHYSNMYRKFDEELESQAEKIKRLNDKTRRQKKNNEKKLERMRSVDEITSTLNNLCEDFNLGESEINLLVTLFSNLNEEAQIHMIESLDDEQALNEILDIAIKGLDK